MANLTITVEEEVLKRARIAAIQRGTSVNAVLREYLRAYAGEDPAMQARRELAGLARRSTASSGKKGRSWTREGLHER